MMHNGNVETTNPSRQSHARRDFLTSMVVLAFIVAVVLGGLASDENWRKLLRVAIAALTYGAVLLTLLKGGRRTTKAGGGLPFWAFAVAAASAELDSGWLRTNASVGLSLFVAPIAALLVGGIHWLTLRAWRPLRERIVSGRSLSSRRTA